MLSRMVSRIAIPAVGLFAALAPLAYAAPQSRIVAAISDSSRVPLQHTIPSRARIANDLGSAPGSTKLNSLSLRFNMTDAQQAALTQLLSAQQNPSSPSYHKWLTPEQFGASFGLSSADIGKVSAWLTSQGFTVTGVARSSTFITFSGTIAQAQQAFGTSIHTLSLNGEQHISNVTDPTLPSSVAGVVTAITGLNDFKFKPRTRVRVVKPQYTQTTNDTVSHFVAPADFYKIYDVPAPSTGITGTGIKVAVMGQVDLVPTDIASFRSAAGLPANAPVLQLAGSDPGPPTSSGNGPTIDDLNESSLDVEWAGAAAPDATIIFVYGDDVFANSLTQAIDNSVAPIITTSYGGCESSLGQSFLNAYSQLLQMANAEGITVFGPTGDAGATDCDTSGLATEGLNVDFPGSSPFVTAVGGTMFNEGSGSYWSASNGMDGGSAMSYIPELPWNETTAAGGLDAGGAGGGGASAFFSKPAWQVCTAGSTTGACSGNTPSDSARDVPDISLNAASNHDGYLLCSQGSCVNGFLTSSGQLNVAGGTSFATPSFAGLLALVEQKVGAANTTTGGFGNINPTLYGLANSTYYNNVFHDVTSGNNSVPCLQGTPNCPSGGSIGYNASVGYDQASGLGSVDASIMINDWKNAPAAGGGGNAVGTALSSVSVTTTSALCAVSGSIPLSVTVSSSTTSTTAVPTGTVQFFIDGTATGSPVALTSGTATSTITFPATLSGGHGISAVYSGDATYAGSRAAVLAADGTLASVDIVSTTQKDFSLTPCTAATTALPGGTSSGVTFTITPANGFTGSVNLIASPNNVISATTSFTVTPVVITSTTGVTTSFVVTAYVTNSAHVAPRKMPFSKMPWYAAGSGATLAGMILLTVPRRRRWGALLAVVLSVAAVGAVGCGGSSSSTTTPPTNPTTTTNAAAGTYSYTITAVSGSLVHSTQVTLTVQ
jgi:subtilase family serine protease